MRGTAKFVVAAAWVVLAAGCASSPAGQPIAAGLPGAEGPCETTRRDLAPPFSSSYAVSVFEPAGDGQPWTAGQCDDDQRPVVLIAHGYLGVFADAYHTLIHHLTSVGFVVVFAPFQVDYDPDTQYAQVDSGIQFAVEQTPRADTSRFGIASHSFGGGMTPYLIQQADARGWGTDAIWSVQFAPHFPLKVDTEPIGYPDHARALVVTYEHDVFVDARIAIEMHAQIDLPADQKEHLMVLTDASAAPALMADHLGPLGVSAELLPGIGLGTLRPDHFDLWAAQRPFDAVARCAISGEWCDVDLADMGTFPSGRPVKRALIGDEVVDRGPIALQECGFFMYVDFC